MLNYTISIAALIIGFFIAWLIRVKQNPTDTIVLQEKTRQLENDKISLNSIIERLREELNNALAQAASLKALDDQLQTEHKLLKVSMEEKQELLISARQTIATLEADFKNAQNVNIQASVDMNTIKLEKSKLQNVHEQLLEQYNATKQELATVNESLKRISETKQQLENTIGLLSQRNDQLILDNKKLGQQVSVNTETISNITERKNQLEVEREGLKTTIINLQSEKNQLNAQINELEAAEEDKRVRYENNMATLNSIRQQISLERNNEVEARNKAEIERLGKLKETWNLHQDYVKQIIKNIANKHTIDYIDHFPFKGDPDNTLKICEELVIFDAKSPGSPENLANFPNYLKDQAEKAKKYAKQEGVKKDIFFVVPSNTLEKLTQFVFKLGDYDVFIISIDSLEQIILSLKKIEEYEFAENLSPEDRDNICRVLGKFAHLTKRRIQIDSFFAKQFIELAYKTESDLPKEILEKVVEYEKSEKLNPPVERRAKAISTKELDKDTAKLKTEASAKGIMIDEIIISNGLNDMPLYSIEPE